MRGRPAEPLPAFAGGAASASALLSYSGSRKQELRADPKRLVKRNISCGEEALCLKISVEVCQAVHKSVWLLLDHRPLLYPARRPVLVSVKLSYKLKNPLPRGQKTKTTVL